MANKYISDLTASTSLASTDEFELDNGTNSRKITATNAAKSFQALGFQAIMLKKSADETAANYGSGAPIGWNAEVYDTIGLSPLAATVTITIASPGVVTWTGHNFLAGSPIVLTTTGALPTGLTAGTTYYVLSPAANTFQLAASPGGSAINTTGSQSGTHTATNYSRITIPSSLNGRYAQFGSAALTSANTFGVDVTLALTKNGGFSYDGAVDFSVEAPSANINASATFASGPILLATGDYFEAQLFNRGDTSITITAARSNFWMNVVG